MKKIFSLLLFLSFLTPTLQAKDKDREYFTVTQVKDARTIVLDNSQTIQLIGVKCPSPDDPNEKIKKWGIAAKEFTEKMLLKNKVWLDSQKEQDGKTWAFVKFVMNLEKMSGVVDQGYMPFWGTAGKFMANRELIANGFCSTSSPFSFKYRSQFNDLEKTARLKQRGMWSDFAQ